MNHAERRMKRTAKRFLLICLILLAVFCPVPAPAEYDGVAYRIQNLAAKFPHGRFWNHYVAAPSDRTVGYPYDFYSDTVTDTPCADHDGGADIGEYDCNAFEAATQCWGFANKCFYEVFGVHCSDPAYTTTHTNKWDILPGDHVRIGGHSVFVKERNGSKIRLIECNYGPRCQIRWERELDIASFEVEWIRHANNWEQVNMSHGTESRISYAAPEADSGVPDPQVKYYGIKVILSSVIPVREGYRFVCWKDMLSPDETGYDPGMEYDRDEPLELVAVWQPAQVKITLDADGGIMEEAEEATVDRGTEYTLPVPEKEGFRFEGWKDALKPDPTLPDTVYEGVLTVRRDYALIARWRAWTRLDLPFTAVLIGEEAFAGCAFDVVLIPSGVSRIGKNAFKDSANLCSAVIYSRDAVIEDGAFDGCPSLTVHGYSGSTAENYALRNGIRFAALDEVSF